MPSENTPSWAKDLDWRERVFVEEYLSDLNATRAYRRAGLAESSDVAITSIRTLASRMLARPQIAAAIEALLQERAVTRQWVINEIAQTAHFDISEYASFDGEKLTWKPWDELTADQRKFIAGAVPHLDAKTGDITYEIKFHNDRKAALDKLAKLLRMEVTRTEVSGPNGGPVEVSDPKARIRDRLEEMAAKLREKEEKDGAGE